MIFCGLTFCINERALPKQVGSFSKSRDLFTLLPATSGGSE